MGRTGPGFTWSSVTGKGGVTSTVHALAMWSWLTARIEALGVHIARYGWSDPTGVEIAPVDRSAVPSADLPRPGVAVGPEDDLLGHAREVHA